MDRAPLVPGRGLGWGWEVAQSPPSREGHLDLVVTLMGNQVFGNMEQKSM